MMYNISQREHIRLHRIAQFVMSNKREFMEGDKDEPFMRRVEERRQSGYHTRKREGKERSKRKKAFNCDAVKNLPLDVIVSKILTRLPVKSLLRFRSVCKYFRDMTSDPWFISQHLEQSKKNPVFIIAPFRPHKQTDISLYKYRNTDENMKKGMKTATRLFKQEFSETLQAVDTPLHANGLILLSAPPSLVVCNPCTREFIKLPDGHPNAEVFRADLLFLPKRPCSRAALSYVSSSNSYKVVQYFYRYFGYTEEGICCSVGLEILALGGKKENLRWETASEDSPYPIDSASPRAVGESVYFKIANDFHGSTPKALLSYNLKDENYRVVDLPSHYMTDFEAINIVDLEGDACFTYMPKFSVMDVWILSSADFTLYRKFSIDFLGSVYFCEPVAFRNGKFLVHLCEGNGIQRLDYYDPENACFENVALLRGDMSYYERENYRLRVFNQGAIFKVTSFVESLATVAGSATIT